MPRYGDSKTSKKQRKKSKRSEMIDNSEEPLKAYKMVQLKDLVKETTDF